jgi:alpha-D-xyloside xylohydrolase
MDNQKVHLQHQTAIQSRSLRPGRLIAFILILCAPCLLVGSLSAAVLSVNREAHGVILQMDSGALRLEVYTPRIVRVTFVLGTQFPATQSLAVIRRPEPTHWTLAEQTNEIVLRTSEIQVHIDRATGAIGFYYENGTPVLQERLNGRSLIADRVANQDSFRSRQEFVLAPGEAVYGLGQHQQGVMNYRGTTVHLQQENREVAVPTLVSSRGYGVFWDNPSITDVDVGENDSNTLAWTSESADAIDYYFLFGPDLDQVISDYRTLSGEAPMFGKWAWGFWQCKEHYASQEELLQVADWYREHHIPLDCVIQDWYYWAPHPWGSHQFDTNRYPDFAGLMNQLHSENVHLIISVWARFDEGSSNWLELKNAEALYPEVFSNFLVPANYQYYDPLNPIARRIYWRQISRELFAAGIDGWWLDASEPELNAQWGQYRDFMTAAGPGFKVFNAYPLMHTTGIYQGQRAESSDKRVFILTRSAWAGQQRNAAVTWSGDIDGNWNVFAKQIPAGLNFTASGIPYWNTDIGGFFGGDSADPGYAELFTRWFQFGAFCPMFRVHGTSHPKEMWRFGTNTQAILIRYDDLRYHLVPYIYSVAWQVTSHDYTMMRPLVMDFRSDTNVYNIADQYLFGPGLMICPVTRPGIANRAVYLPSGTQWIDFWTGETFAGGQKIVTAAPIQTLPVFVRAGSIIPYGPDVQYATAKADPIELRIYPGADGHFVLYEDEGDNYDYEHGKYATIPISWDDSRHILDIGKRRGRFPGMLQQRTFRIVLVSPGHGAGIPLVAMADTVVGYNGRELKIVPGK